MNFKDFKKEILKRAKDAYACMDEYKRAYQSNDWNGLMIVIKDNFNFAITRKVIDLALIELYRERFNENQIYCNESVTSGFLLAYNKATVTAYNDACVTSYYPIECVLNDNAIHRIQESNTIRYASDDIKFERITLKTI